MYWYLRDSHPYEELQDIGKLHSTMYRTSKGLESAWDRMAGEDRVEIARRMQEWDSAPGRFLYYPNPKEQWYFLQPHRVKGISGANRSGKTCTHSNELIAQAEGWHPLQRDNLDKLATKAVSKKVREHCGKLMDEGKFIADPPIEGRVVAVDYGFIERVNGKELVKWATPSEIKYIGYDNEKKRKIEWKNGSYIEFMTHEQDLDTHGGASRDVIMFDEEAPQPIWTESLLRVADCNGRILYGCTGVEGVTWSDEAIWVPGLRGDHPSIYAIEMTTYDNPTITDAAINEIKSLCSTEQEVQIRIYGKRVRKGGLVYETKDEYPWIIPVFEKSEVFSGS